MRRPTFLLPLGILAGCLHSDLPEPGSTELDAPFLDIEPLRLTYSPGVDRTPKWSRRDGWIMYAFDEDRLPSGATTGCVGELPLPGGTRGAEYCETDPQFMGVPFIPGWPAQRQDGSVAFVRRRTGTNLGSPGALDFRNVPAGLGNEEILPIPFFAGGITHQGVSHINWLDDGHLLFIGLGIIRSTNEFTETGLDLLELDIANGLAGVTKVPGTTYASSATLGATADTIYYTIGGDSMVYRRVRSTGVVDTVVDFGGLGIARDVGVEAGRLIAVVGGAVSFGPHPTFGMAQHDFGGPIYMVELPDGTPILVSFGLSTYRHPALAPDGKQIVAEQFGDLWSIALP